ncbi:MAG: TRAM domain-containing protein [Kiritimatiellae bacterium]|nr:TRAM domain-containing protein [Kiritimatiellia bacterium]
MIRIGDILRLRILDVVYRGRGLARHEGEVVFVDGVAPGEDVVARVTVCKRRYAEARLQEVLSASEDRCVPCARLPDGDRVPGCVYDHLAYAAEVALKLRQLRGFLAASIGTDLPELTALPSPRPLHYRNKTVLHAQRRGHGVAKVGYFGEDNRTIVDLPACPLACPEINADWQSSQSALRRELADGETVTWRWTVTDGVVRWRGRADDAAPPLTELSAAGSLRVPRDGFYQVNPEVADALVRQVRDWFSEAAAESRCSGLLDLYCGVGVFALACAQASGLKRVCGIETNGAAVAAARHNARELGVDASFRCGTVAATAGALFEGHDPARTVVIADPPRQGLEPAAVAVLCETRPAHIIHVSCDPATLARDLRVLAAGGYRTRAIRLFDMFPRTAHFESAVWLTSARCPVRAAGL